MIDYRRFPEKCQAVIREQAAIGEGRVQAAVRIATSKCAAEYLRQAAEGVEDASMPTWQVGLIGGSRLARAWVGCWLGS